MFNFLKMIWLCFWAIVATGILFFPITIAALFSRTGNLAFNLSKIWAWFMLKVTLVRAHIVGREKIQKNRSYVIISNHQSLFDIPALVTQLGLQFRWIIKKELRKIPLFFIWVLFFLSHPKEVFYSNGRAGQIFCPHPLCSDSNALCRKNPRSALD